jgi:hypothetical protein
MKETKLELSEKGKAPYFEISKSKDQYVFLILLSGAGALLPICKNAKNIKLKTILNATMEGCGMSLIEYFNSQEKEQYYCRTLKDKRHWKKIQNAIKEAI